MNASTLLPKSVEAKQLQPQMQLSSILAAYNWSSLYYVIFQLVVGIICFIIHKCMCGAQNLTPVFRVYQPDDWAVKNL